jgi:hypothetical protein
MAVLCFAQTTARYPLCSSWTDTHLLLIAPSADADEERYVSMCIKRTRPLSDNFSYFGGCCDHIMYVLVQSKLVLIGVDDSQQEAEQDP